MTAHVFHPPPEASIVLPVLTCSRCAHDPHHAGDHYLRWAGRVHGVEWSVEVTWRHP